jgi:hypothetical protein
LHVHAATEPCSIRTSEVGGMEGCLERRVERRKGPMRVSICTALSSSPELGDSSCCTSDVQVDEANHRFIVISRQRSRTFTLERTQERTRTNGQRTQSPKYLAKYRRENLLMKGKSGGLRPGIFPKGLKYTRNTRFTRGRPTLSDSSTTTP